LSYLASDVVKCLIKWLPFKFRKDTRYLSLEIKVHASHIPLKAKNKFEQTNLLVEKQTIPLDFIATSNPYSRFIVHSFHPLSFQNRKTQQSQNHAKYGTCLNLLILKACKNIAAKQRAKSTFNSCFILVISLLLYFSVFLSFFHFLCT
jgi:hypothetical protein